MTFRQRAIRRALNLPGALGLGFGLDVAFRAALALVSAGLKRLLSEAAATALETPSGFALLALALRVWTRCGSTRPRDATFVRGLDDAAARTDRGEVFSSASPHFADTQELHARYYPPLRHPDSPIRSAERFELGLNPVPPIVRGFPGWLRWQHGWRSNYVYAGHLDSREPFDAAPTVVSPADLMTTLVDGRVRVIFKARDNRFCRADVAAGESVFGPAAEGDLGRFGSASGRALLERTRLQQPMTVFHVADIADADTDGHGFLWVEADGTELDAFEVDHDGRAPRRRCTRHARRTRSGTHGFSERSPLGADAAIHPALIARAVVRDHPQRPAHRRDLFHRRVGAGDGRP